MQLNGFSTTLDQKQRDRVEHILSYVQWDVLTERELDLMGSFEAQFQRNGNLSDRQLEVMESIFSKSNERDA